MGDLHVNDDSSTGSASAAQPGPPPHTTRPGRSLRSLCFFVLYFAYLVLVMGLGQRLLVWPLIVLAPGRRRAVVRAWLQWNARATLAMSRVVADVRVGVSGNIEPGSCIVVMNHQSVLDIPLGISLVHGPYPLIP